MSYLVMARKFRPRTFGEVTGQEPVVRTLENAIGSGRIAHAFVFSGPRGVGKTTMARILAKALNCEQGPTAEPCLECSACREIADGHDIDVLEIDGASNRGIDEVKQIRENVRYSPSRDRFKIFIIDEVHMLTGPAFNALLKTLEEPPSHVKFIFATTELHAIPSTVLSRCQQHEFRRIPFREIVERLRSIAADEGLQISEEATLRLARAADGSLRDGLGALDQVVAFGGDKIEASDVAEVLGLVDRELVYDTAEAVLGAHAEGVIRAVERLATAGYDLRSFADELTEHFRNLVVVKTVPEPDELLQLGEQEKKRLAGQAATLGEDDLLRLLNVVGSAEQELTRSNLPRYTLERILLRMVSLGRLRPLEELLARFGDAPPPAPAADSRPAARGPGRKAASGAAGKKTGRSGAGGPRSEVESPAAPPADERPEPVSPPPAAAEGDLLSALVKAVGLRKRSLAAFVERAASVERDGKTLTLSFHPDDRYFRSTLEEDPSRRLLEQVASELCGGRTKVRLAELTQAGDQAVGGNREQELRDLVRQDGVVKDFIEVFEGEVLDCEES